MFFRVAKIPHEVVVLSFMKGEHKSEKITKLNPFGILPFVEHDGVVLRESMAILRYVTKVFDVPDHWYPKDLMGEQKVNEYLHWQHLTTRLSCAMYFQNKILLPCINEKPINKEELEKFWTRMNKTLDEIEQIWLDNGKKNYIAGGDKISVADIVAVCELEQPLMAGFDVRTNRPVLTAYMERIRLELNPHYDDVHQKVYQVRDAFKGEIPSKEEFVKYF